MAIKNEHIGIHQNFPNPDSSKFFTVKILHHTVVKILWLKTPN